MDALGFELTSWGEPLAAPLDVERLRGRYYVRARRTEPDGSTMVVDATYENDRIPFAQAWGRRRCRDGIAVAAEEDLATLTEMADRDRGSLAP